MNVFGSIPSFGLSKTKVFCVFYSICSSHVSHHLSEKMNMLFDCIYQFKWMICSQYFHFNHIGEAKPMYTASAITTFFFFFWTIYFLKVSFLNCNGFSNPKSHSLYIVSNNVFLHVYTHKSSVQYCSAADPCNVQQSRTLYCLSIKLVRSNAVLTQTLDIWLQSYWFSKQLLFDMHRCHYYVYEKWIQYILYKWGIDMISIHETNYGLFHSFFSFSMFFDFFLLYFVLYTYICRGFTLISHIHACDYSWLMNLYHNIYYILFSWHHFIHLSKDKLESNKMIKMYCKTINCKNIQSVFRRWINKHI